MVKRFRANKNLEWRTLVDGISWRDTERRAAWKGFERYIQGRKMRLQNNERLIKELRAARAPSNVNNNLDVRDGSRKTRHLDVAESAASCCYMIEELEHGKGQGLGFSSANAKRGGSASRNIVKALSRGPITRGLNRNSY